MFFQVQKLLLTCLDSFVRRRTSSAMRRLSRLTPVGCVFFPIHRVHSFCFFVYDQLLQQQTVHPRWEKIRIPREWVGWVGALLRKSVGGRNCLNKWVIFGPEKHNFTKLFNCIMFYHKALVHRWWKVHSISSPVLSLVWHVGLTHIRLIHYRTDIEVVVVVVDIIVSFWMNIINRKFNYSQLTKMKKKKIDSLHVPAIECIGKKQMV